VIFRLQLFKPSEPFIANQVRNYRRYHPIFLGRRKFGPSPWDDATVCTSNSSRLATAKLILLRNCAPFAASLADKRISLLHAHFGVDAVYALDLSARLKVPLVTTLHGFDVTTADRSFLKTGRPALVNAVMHRRALQRWGSLFLCVSEFIRDAALAKGYPVDRTIVHYIGIDTQRLTARADAGEDGLVVHVARLVEKKGTSFLLRAMQGVRKTHPNARLVVIGDGPLRPSLEEEAAHLGLGDAVEFTGMLPNADVMRYVRMAAVMAVPSITAGNGDAEGLPTVNMEANAQGVPLVASDSGGIKEAIVDGDTGFLTPERDVEAIAERITTLLSQPSLRIAMGKNARKLIESKFDIRRQSELLESYYDEALKGKWKP
jgi:glycosyltransferase involved in cell wall biosynthesis